MKNKISLVITYRNEENSIKKTLQKIITQRKKPDEVILINSGSTDKSRKIVEDFIEKNKKNYQINFKNFALDTNFPSTSKNLGIQVAKNDLIAFMDCGLNFDDYWLENQLNFLKKKKLHAVLGFIKLEGYSTFDKAAIANTYGHKSFSDCIPGSLIYKKIFQKIGFFEKSRSLYDVLWKRKLYKSKFNYNRNTNYILKYLKTNYASNFKNLFNKSTLYTSDKLLALKYPQTFLYLFFPIFSVIILATNPKLIIPIFIAYIFARLLKAFTKSKEKKIFLNINFLNLVVLTAITIDISRCFGAFNSVVKLIGSNFLIICFLVLYFIIFNTPLVSILGNNLISNVPLSQNIKYDAIVVFSGDGDTSYNNVTYRQRSLDAIKYAKEFEVDKILLSSGRDHTISEVELLRLFLIDQNIDKQKIYIFDKFPSSTYQNILMVGNRVLEMDYKNIIFITSPFHYKRSMLIWNKNFKKINIFPVKNVSFNFNKYKWIQNLNEIKIIIYEYSAIIYNYTKGYF